jgi:hypothetical protein
MTSKPADWEADFPIHEEFTDCAGRRWAFVITCFERGVGFTVRASEECKQSLGYEFAAYSETSPYSALCRVRVKARHALATRHVIRENGGFTMLHDEVNGRITWDGETGMTLVVDGVPMKFEDLASLLGACEGWEFQLRIIDPLQ